MIEELTEKNKYEAMSIELWLNGMQQTLPYPNLRRFMKSLKSNGNTSRCNNYMIYILCNLRTRKVRNLFIML